MANFESIERFYELDDYLYKHQFKPKEFAAEFKAGLDYIYLAEESGIKQRSSWR